jgi:hypothetical protein
LRVSVLTIHPFPKRFPDYISSTTFSTTPQAVVPTSGNIVNCTTNPISLLLISSFESRLNVVFEYLHTIYTSFDGRIKADNFRRQVMAVTSVWETWMIFNNSNVEGWVKTFLGQVGGEEEMMENVEEVVEQPVEKKGRWNSVLDTSGKAAQITDVEKV